LSKSATLACREQFRTPGQQRETASTGMWIFLANEVMMFGALFTAYTVYRASHPQAFDIGSADMNILLGSVNTALLLTSSLMLTFAEHSAQAGNQRLIAIFLVLTMIIGLVFLGLKFAEYYQHFQEHKAPGVWFNDSSPYSGSIQMFFVFYFIMTGLHAVHMIIGIGILAGLLFRTLIGTMTAEYHTPILFGGLYWHFVDIVWIFLYAIFYLPGLHL
jgi:cytochrome c oxidase subunit III